MRCMYSSWFTSLHVYACTHTHIHILVYFGSFWGMYTHIQFGAFLIHFSFHIGFIESGACTHTHTMKLGPMSELIHD